MSLIYATFPHKQEFLVLITIKYAIKSHIILPQYGNKFHSSVCN